MIGTVAKHVYGTEAELNGVLAGMLPLPFCINQGVGLNYF